MLNVGAGEIVFILVVALLVLGPQRLPQAARGIGRFMRELRRHTHDVRTTVERELYLLDEDDASAPVTPRLPRRAGSSPEVATAPATTSEPGAEPPLNAAPLFAPAVGAVSAPRRVPAPPSTGAPLPSAAPSPEAPSDEDSAEARAEASSAAATDVAYASGETAGAWPPGDGASRPQSAEGGRAEVRSGDGAEPSREPGAS